MLKVIGKIKRYIRYKVKLGTLIANNRNSYFIKKINEKVKWFIKNYENANYDIATNGEEFVIKELQLKPGSIVFDVGFNKGDWTKAVLKHCPDANLFGFEPQAELLNEARKEFEMYKDVRLFNFGLSDKSFNGEIYIYENHDFLSGIYNHPHNIPNYKKEVSFKKSSDFFIELGLQKIDFLKIDVEGAEHLVLKGFEDILKQGKILAIQFEYGKGSINSKFLLKDYYEYLEPMGYKLGKIYPNFIDFKSYNWDDENFIGPNYLAIFGNR